MSTSTSESLNSVFYLVTYTPYDSYGDVAGVINDAVFKRIRRIFLFVVPRFCGVIDRYIACNRSGRHFRFLGIASDVVINGSKWQTSLEAAMMAGRAVDQAENDCSR